jgi:hypothetical protein
VKPTETGWYWYKFLSKPWAVVYVHSFNGRFGVRGNGRIFWLDEEANGFIECVGEKRAAGEYGHGVQFGGIPMKAFARRLLRPLMNWLALGSKCGLCYGFTTSGWCYFEFTDPNGVSYSWLESPDEARELAWKIIAAADSADDTNR